MEEEDGEEDGQDGWWRGMELSNVNGNVTKWRAPLAPLGVSRVYFP